MRIHAIDYLRVCMNYARCIIHISIPYMLWVSPVWPVYDGGNLFFDALVLGLHGFVMEIFFMISGLLAYLQFKRGDFDLFLKNRVKKLVIPFIISMLLFVPIILSYFVIRDDGYSLFQLSILDSIAIYQKAFLLMIKGSFITAHYWFLYYLILFYAIWLCSVKISSLKTFLETFFERINLKKYLLLYSYVIVFVSFLMMPKWIVENPLNLMVELKPFVYYGAFFFIGIKISRFKNYFDYFQQKHKYYLIAAVCIFTIMAKFQEFYPVKDLQYRNVYELGAKISHSLFTFFSLIGLTGLFMNRFNSKSNKFRYLSDASYTVYIVHLPIVMFCHLILQHYHFSIFIKFLISLVISISLAHLIYEYGVRYTFLGDYLGKRKTRKLKK